MAIRRFACLCASLVLVLGGCDDTQVVDDAGMDAGARDAGRDAGSDAGSDAGQDAGGPVDAGPTDQCLAYAANLEGPDGSAGLGATIGDAIEACTRSSCTSCALAGGMGTSCGAGGTLTSCVLGCLDANDFGACPGGTCAAGQTCDTSIDPSVCRNDAVTAVNDAITAGDIDLACTSCYANIPQCVASSGCLSLSGGCFDPTSCECDLCQCDNGCIDAFTACSGLPPYRDCAAVEAMCGGP